jgi:anti-sigma-K factor RskA
VTHEDLQESLAAWAIGALRANESREVESHLASCAMCRDEAAGLSEVALSLAASGPLETPSDAVRSKVMARTAGRAAVVAPPVKLSEREARRGFSWAPWLAAAASLLLAAYFGMDSARARRELDTVRAELQAARAEAAATGVRLASLQQASDRSESAFAVLVAPDVARIDLAAQPGQAPSASARAFWSRARGMVFSATSLPAPPPGRTYQVWVVTKDPAPLSAGLIEPDVQGRVNVVFATPATIAQPIAVAVTLEPAGGVPAPTGPKVLVGLV